VDAILSEANLRTAVDLLVRLVEAAGALIIFCAARQHSTARVRGSPPL